MIPSPVRKQFSKLNSDFSAVTAEKTKTIRRFGSAKRLIPTLKKVNTMGEKSSDPTSTFSRDES